MAQVGKGDQHHTNSVLLQGLSKADLDRILAQCSRKNYPRDSQIVREMDQDKNLYLVESGILGVSQYTSSGKEVSYTELGVGENFGELAAIDGKPRSASVIALTDCEVTVVPFSAFESQILSNHTAAREIMRQLCRIIRRLCERIYEFSTLSVNNRIHAELLRLARRNIDLDGVARIATPPTHTQIGSRVSCNREAVSRELKQLEKKGILQKPDKRWVIPDCGLLQKMVDEVHKL
jgi:CRP/FNR family cyclic AMP-dependent transcriptional regulator